MRTLASLFSFLGCATCFSYYIVVVICSTAALFFMVTAMINSHSGLYSTMVFFAAPPRVEVVPGLVSQNNFIVLCRAGGSAGAV